MTSMTGYGYKEVSTDSYSISVEIKSVNSRFLDLSVNLPSYLNPLESYFRNKVQDNVVRGKVDVYIKVKELNSRCEVVADTKAALSYYNAIKQIADACGYDEKSIPLSMIINQEGVLNSNKSYDIESYKKLIDPVFAEAYSDFITDRKREGENMKKDLCEKLLKLVECADFFTEWQPKMETYFKEMILSKFNELLGQNIDENRILSETALMLVKYTINEEIVRLKSHISAMQNELENNPIPGKRLDFICQEMNREINTIGSKNQFAEVGAMVVNAKDALENIREQSKNVE